jgi:hypothetical protein
MKIKWYDSVEYCYTNAKYLGEGYAKTCYKLANNKNVIKISKTTLSLYELELLEHHNFELSIDLYNDLCQMRSSCDAFPQFLGEWIFWYVILNKKSDKKYFAPIKNFGLFHTNRIQGESDIALFTVMELIEDNYSFDRKMREQLSKISRKYSIIDVMHRTGGDEGNVFSPRESIFKIIDYGFIE